MGAAAAWTGALAAALALACPGVHAQDDDAAAWPEAVVAAAPPSGWVGAAVAEELPPAPADWGDRLASPAGARHVGYGWTLRRGRSSIRVSIGATEYLVALDEASAADTATVLAPSVQLGWHRRLSEHTGVYAATDTLGMTPVRRARLGFEWTPFRGSRLGIAHGGLRIRFDDQSRMLLKVRRSSFSAYWQARF